MTSYEDFKTEIKKQGLLSPDINMRDKNDFYTNIPGDYVAIEWTTGGSSGGDCWGGRSEPIESKSEPDFTGFENAVTLIMGVCSTWGFYLYLQKLGLVHHGEYRSYYDYYGNGHESEYKYILLNDIHTHCLSFYRQSKIEKALDD